MNAYEVEPSGLSRKKTWEYRLVAGAFLVLLAVAAHSPGFYAGFVIDDEAYVTGNETLRDTRGLRSIWFDLDSSPQYYPLVFSSFWVEHQVWGASPAGYHATNIILHALNALLVWLVLARLSVPGAWLAAAIFAVHPVHVESIAWVAERKNVLSALFFLLAGYLFLRFRDLETNRERREASRYRYLASLVLFILAMLSKTASVSFPFVLLLVIWWKRGRVERRDVMQVGPMFVIGTALALVTVWIETTRGGASGELWDLSGLERVLLASRAVWFYVGKLVWPVDLSFNYARWHIDSGTWYLYLYPLALGAVLWALWALRTRLGRGPLVGVLFFIVTLGPTLGFINVYFFRYSFVADHFQYLSSIGLIALGVAGAAIWAEARGPRATRALPLLPGLILVTLALLTWQRSWVFRDLETLCLDTREKNPGSWLAINNLGNIRLERGELDAAIIDLETAREISPTYIETHLNLAIAYMNVDRFEDSIASSRRAIELKPENKFGYKHLADALVRSGRAEAAIPWFEEALLRDPDYLEAKSGLGSALAQIGHYGRAMQVLLEVLAADPDHVASRTSLAITLVRTGRTAEAIEQFEKALELDPHNDVLQQNLALARRVSNADPSGQQD